MKVMIVGAGRVGSALARNLVEDSNTVVVIEQQADRRDWLASSLPEATIVVGNGTDPQVLEANGVRNVDVLVAVTDTDQANVLASSIAKVEFDVPRTIARIVDPRFAWLFTPEMGVDVALEQADLIARLVAEEMSLGELTTLMKLRRGQYALVEQRIDADAAVVGSAVRDLDLPGDCVLVAVLRDEGLVAAHGPTVLEAGDEVLAVVHSAVVAELEELLTRPQADDTSGS